MFSNFNKLKLRSQILWGYSVPILLAIGVALGVYGNVKTVEKQTQVVEEAHQIVDDVKDIALSLADMQRATRGYLLAKNEESLTVYNEAKNRFNQLSNNLNSLIKDSQQRQELERIIKLGTRVDILNESLISLVDRGDSEQAIEIWRAGEGRELARQLKQNLTAFEQREQNILNQRIKVESDALKGLTTVVFFGTSLSALLAIAIGLWIASRISQTVNETAGVIATSATEIATTVEQQERTAVQQSASVNQTSATMEELAVSSRQSAEQAEAAAMGAQQVLTLIDGSISIGQLPAGGQSSLREKVGQIASQILRLSEQVSQIYNIANSVGDLANQTNMLALNAAVEAARAGEHGKGFAVVATEIRKLADQSKKSAERINTLVADIQNATNSTVMVTEEGTKTVESIVIAINEIALNSQQISLTAKQQALAVQQVVEAMNVLNKSAKETAAGISQTKVGTQNLNNAALNLKTVV